MTTVPTKTYEQRYAEYRQRLLAFRLLDDTFMTKVFEDKDCVELLLRIILQKSDLYVKEFNVQQVVMNLQGRSVRFDIFAADSTGKVYDIEIQRADDEADIKRARYNASLMDANITDPGDKHQNLKESYIIFITENDVFKRGLPIYYIDRRFHDTGELCGDEQHIIYVNAEITDETTLGRLMHDMRCTEPDDMNYRVLADRVRYLKEDEEGVTIMCKVMDELRDEATFTAKLEAVITIMETLKLSVQDALKALKIPESEHERYIAAIKAC